MHVTTEQLHSIVISRGEATQGVNELNRLLEENEVAVGNYPILDSLYNVLEAIAGVEQQIIFTAEVDQEVEAE